MKLREKQPIFQSWLSFQIVCLLNFFNKIIYLNILLFLLCYFLVLSYDVKILYSYCAQLHETTGSYFYSCLGSTYPTVTWAFQRRVMRLTSIYVIYVLYMYISLSETMFPRNSLTAEPFFTSRHYLAEGLTTCTYIYIRMSPNEEYYVSMSTCFCLLIHIYAVIFYVLYFNLILTIRAN